MVVIRTLFMKKVFLTFDHGVIFGTTLSIQGFMVRPQSENGELRSRSWRIMHLYFYRLTKSLIFSTFFYTTINCFTLSFTCRFVLFRKYSSAILLWHSTFYNVAEQTKADLTVVKNRRHDNISGWIVRL